MSFSSLLIGLGLGLCTFAVTWAMARHFTGLDQEHGLALAIAIVVGLFFGIGYVVVESRLFESWLRRNGH